MQPEFPDRCRNPACEFPDARLFRRMGQRDEDGTGRPCNDIAGPAQATLDRLPDAAQARVGGMPTKDVDIRLEFVERKRDE